MMPSILTQPTNGRFDIYKRAKRHKGRSFFEHRRDEHGSIVRLFPKTPGRYAIRKNTKRARAFNAAIERQVAVAQSIES